MMPPIRLGLLDMKTHLAFTLAIALCSTSALAFQEKPLAESSGSEQKVQRATISQFSGDENDGDIAHVYGQGLCSSSAASNCNSAFSTTPQHMANHDR